MAPADPTPARLTKHAPSTVTPASGPAQTLTYDANGNMLTGLDGKIMTYDGENRPLSVTWLGKKTCYVYGVDGTRRKKIENYSPTQACSAPTAAQPVTAYLGSVEIRKFGQGAAEELLLYPHASIRIAKTKDAGGAIVTGVSTLHRDAQGSVRAVTTAAGLEAENTVYRPFGEETTTVNDLATAPETKGYIGERFDTDAGLQFLNARYYDPKLGMFTQPDWWEVTKAGVGTNRYAYSGNDPINGTDASGHQTTNKSLGKTLGSFFESLLTGLGLGNNKSSGAALTNGKAVATSLGNDAKSAVSSTAKAAIGLTVVGGVQDTIAGVKSGSIVETLLGLLGIVPGGKIVGKGVSKTIELLTATRTLANPAEKLAKEAKIAQAAVGGKGAVTGLADEIDILRKARLGKGNFGLGQVSAQDAVRLGQSWVGDGYKVASDGKTLVRSDGLRQFRPPTEKPRLGTTQSNFEQRLQPMGEWQSNGHLDILP